MYIQLMAESQSPACVCVNLRSAARSVTKLYDEALAPSGLLVTQFSLMRKVSAVGTIALGELAASTGMDQSTVTRNVRPLLRDGYLRVRALPEDRRTRVVALTAKGRAALERALPLWRDTQKRMIARVGDAAWASMADALRRLAG
jgi:DNA-binding MarR family transcriptional regulator